MAEPQLFPVQIGDLIAWGFAVPEQLPWGGAQRLGVHQLPAGRRVIDSLGPDDHDITWKGWFIQRGSLDPDPVEAARYIDYLRKQGQPVTLSWDVFEYQVVIEQFRPSYEYKTRVQFELVLKVVQDNTAPVNSFSQPGADELIDDDFSNILGLAPQLNMTVPAGLPGSFSNTPGAGPFNAAAPATIAWLGSVLGQIGAPLSQPDGTAVPLFTAVAAAKNFVAANAAKLYSADYLKTTTPDPQTTTQPDGTQIPVFATSDQAQGFLQDAQVGFSADYLP